VRAIRAWPGVVDVVVAREDVGAYFDGPPAIDDDRIRALSHATDDATIARDIELPIVYDGPDLEDIARATSLSVADVISIHASGAYVVETIGFAPGFAYLGGLDARLRLPRRATPRVRVPAGSVGIVEDQTAVYPFDSPGGWHLVGRTSTRMFGPEGSLLALGDRVRFVPC
jgi:KipI family sensor histidine kinase inhibitor